MSLPSSVIANQACRAVPIIKQDSFDTVVLNLLESLYPSRSFTSLLTHSRMANESCLSIWQAVFFVVLVSIFLSVLILSLKY